MEFVSSKQTSPAETRAVITDWYLRVKELAKLQSRAQTIFRIVLGKIPVSDYHEPQFPSAIGKWICSKYSSTGDDTVLNTSIELFDCNVPNNYIDISYYHEI